MLPIPFTHDGRDFNLAMLGCDDVQTLAGYFLAGHRAHCESICDGLDSMQKAVVVRDGVPSFVGRAYIFDYIQTIPGAKAAISLAMKRADVPAADVPAILREMCYDDLAELATKLVFKPRTPVGAV